MTYNVSSGTLNSTMPTTDGCLCCCHATSSIIALLHEVQAGTLRNGNVLCLFIFLSPETRTQKNDFSQKLSSLESWSLLTTSTKLYMGFSRNLSLDPWMTLSGNLKVIFVTFWLFLKNYAI